MAFEAGQPLSGIHVLIVDDDSRQRLFVAAALRAWGAQVTATDAAESTGVALAADVIVCDLETVEEAGAGFLDGLFRAHALGGRSVPSIALVPVRGALSGLAARFHRHITKPVTGDELRATVRALISERR
jgi:CheY-like chemotaxis protein